MALKGTRKLIATGFGVAGLVGFNAEMAAFAPEVLSLTTSILTIIGISGLCGYQIRTQGIIDRENGSNDGPALRIPVVFETEENGENRKDPGPSGGGTDAVGGGSAVVGTAADPAQYGPGY